MDSARRGEPLTVADVLDQSEVDALLAAVESDSIEIEIDQINLPTARAPKDIHKLLSPQTTPENSSENKKPPHADPSGAQELKTRL